MVSVLLMQKLIRKKRSTPQGSQDTYIIMHACMEHTYNNINHCCITSIRHIFVGQETNLHLVLTHV